MTVCTPHFGDLPLDAQALLTRTFDLDFSMSDFKAPRWFSAWARDEDGGIAGIFAIEFKYWFDGYVTVLVLDQRCMTKRVLRAIFTAAFTQARRLTAEVEPHNRRALKQVQRLGFQYTGYRRLGIEGSRDVMVFDMLKNECRYLSGYVRPTLPQLDAANLSLRDTVIQTDETSAARVRPDRKHVRSRQLHHLVALAVLVVGMVSAFSDVLLASSPAQMLGTDAARSSATVRGVLSSSRLAVGENTNDAVNLATASVLGIPHLRIASGVHRERPEKTAFISVEQGSSECFFRGVHPTYIRGTTLTCQIMEGV